MVSTSGSVSGFFGVRSGSAGSRSSRSSSTRKRKKHLSAAVVRAWLETAGRRFCSSARNARRCVTFTSASSIPSACKYARHAETSRLYAEQVIGARRRSDAQKRRKSVSSLLVSPFTRPPLGSLPAPAGASTGVLRLTGLLRKKPWQRGFFHDRRETMLPTYANIGSYGNDDPARRRRLVLRVGRAAGRSRVARAAGRRRSRGRAGGELRGEGVRRPDGDGRPGGAAALPACRGRVPPDERLLGGEQGDVPGLRGRHPARRGALDRRGVPRRARDATARGLAGRDRRAPAAPGARAGRPPDHRRRRSHEVPRQGGERRREA